MVPLMPDFTSTGNILFPISYKNSIYVPLLCEYYIKVIDFQV